MSLALTYRHALMLIVALFASMSLGCQIEEPKLRAWSEDPNAQAKLASYALDTQRPLPLRRVALESLVKQRRYNLLMTIFDLTSQRGEDAQAQLRKIAEMLVSVIDEMWSGGSLSLEAESHIAEVSFFLLNVDVMRAEFIRSPNLLKKLTRWALGYLNTDGRKVVPPAQDEEVLIKPQKLLTAVLYTAEEEEGEDDTLLMEIFEDIKADQLKHIDNFNYTLRLHKSIDPLKNARLSKAFASTFLKVAQHVHKNRPHAFTQEAFKAILDNGNMTLLRFLIELGRDQEVIDQKVTKPQELIDSMYQVVKRAIDNNFREEIRPSVFRVISSREAYPSVIFDGIYWAWALGDQSDLGVVLTKITPDFKVPVSGTELRVKVNQVCADISQPDKDQLSEQLEDLLVSLKDQDELWPARLITVTCISQLYPDGKLAELMKKHKLYKNYQKDKKMILAWRSDREVTLGEIVRDYLDPTR